MTSTYLSILKADYEQFETSARMAGVTLSDRETDPQDNTRYRVLATADSGRNFYHLGRQFQYTIQSRVSNN